jgi:hypothetical protein
LDEDDEPEEPKYLPQFDNGEDEEPENDFSTSPNNNRYRQMRVPTITSISTTPDQTQKHRIRERRWIRDEGGAEWYQQQVILRRQQFDDKQRCFATCRTQEDEIRKQFLTLSMERYAHW